MKEGPNDHPGLASPLEWLRALGRHRVFALLGGLLLAACNGDSISTGGFDELDLGRRKRDLGDMTTPAAPPDLVTLPDLALERKFINLAVGEFFLNPDETTIRLGVANKGNLSLPVQLALLTFKFMGEGSKGSDCEIGSGGEEKRTVEGTFPTYRTILDSVRVRCLPSLPPAEKLVKATVRILTHPGIIESDLEDNDAELGFIAPWWK